MQVDDGLLRLHLPALRQATLCGNCDRGTVGTLRVDRDSFAEPPQLEYLVLSALGAMTVMPDAFTGLTALARLDLSECGLIRVPTAVTALSGSLTSLAMPYNNELQLTADDVRTLLALRKLQTLDLQKEPFEHVLAGGAAASVTAQLHYGPALWSQRSLQHLVALPNIFLARHGHALALRLSWDDDSDDEFMDF